MVNVYDDRHHEETAAIAKLASRVVEALNVAGMIRNRRLARAIADAGMSGFLTKLAYKYGWYGGRVREGGPLVCVVQTVRPLWLEERRPDAL